MEFRISFERIAQCGVPSDWRLGNDFGIDDIYFGTPGESVRTDSVHIHVKPLPQLDVPGNSLALCRGNTTQLHAATNTPDITWSPALYLDDVHSAGPTVSNLQSTTTFYIQSQINNCSAIDSVTVIVHDKPAVSIEAVDNICLGSAAILKGKSTNATTYSWKPLTGLAEPASPITAASPDSTTTYTLVAKNENCSDSASVRVIVYPLPTIKINKSNEINCGRRAATLKASGAKDYAWTPLESIQGNTTHAEIIVRPERTTNYRVEGTDGNGCIGTSTVTVAVDKTTGEVYVPNVFTPNHDGRNDIFKATFKRRPHQYECMIYNRLGEVVFSSIDPAKGWNGTHKSVLQSVGTYSYMIKIENDCGAHVMKGSVVLMY